MRVAPDVCALEDPAGPTMFAANQAPPIIASTGAARRNFGRARRERSHPSIAVFRAASGWPPGDHEDIGSTQRSEDGKDLNACRRPGRRTSVLLRLVAHD